MPVGAIPPVRSWPVSRLVSSALAVSALALAACTPSTPAPSQPKPTATRAAGAASPVAAEARAGASPSVSAPASPRSSVGPQVRIADASLADSTPWLSLRNTGDEAISLAGWRLEVGDRAAIVPEGTTLEPGRALTLLARDDINTGTEVFLGADGAGLMQAALPGTPVRLVDTAGKVWAETTVPRF